MTTTDPTEIAGRVWIVIVAGLFIGAMYAAPGVIWDAQSYHRR